MTRFFRLHFECGILLAGITNIEHEIHAAFYKKVEPEWMEVAVTYRPMGAAVVLAAPTAVASTITQHLRRGLGSTEYVHVVEVW